MVVDFHAHWIPPPLADALRKRRGTPRIEVAPAGEYLVTYLGTRPFGPDLGDLSARRAHISRCGIALQVLSLSSLFGADCLPLDESVPLVTAFNNAAAGAIREQPEHFAAIAALPLADVALACTELERAQAIGLRGAILPAEGFLTRASAERFLPLFETGNRLRTHFFLHPGPVEARPEPETRKTPPDNARHRRIVLETQARLSEVIATLELTDYLDPFPNVTVQVANLGGTIPFLLERMDAVCRTETSGEPLPSTRLRRCYVDTASFGPRAIELAVACFGADRVVLGTDCPIFDAEQMLKAVVAARLDDRTRKLVLSGNAQQLLGADRVGEFPGSTKSSLGKYDHSPPETSSDQRRRGPE
jgi:predicted TIM-barrel fold metal-dependent hydrolase